MFVSYRNKVLCGEVKSLKAQIATLLDKGKHDDELLQALMVSHFEIISWSIVKNLDFRPECRIYLQKL